MAETMRATRGVGLSANQVGLNLRLLVMENQNNMRYPRRSSFPFQAYLNARIVRYSKQTEGGWEGCLSIPGYRGWVRRSKKVILEALDPNGKRIRRVFRSFEARVIQHEVDHLDGLFYTDRMDDLKKWMHLKEYNRKFHLRIMDKIRKGNFR